MRHLLPILMIVLSFCAYGQRVLDNTQRNTDNSRFLQTLPENIIFYEGFENAERPHLPNGWTSLSLASTGFISGTAGNTPGQMNENGFWNVPKHGLFAASNDDVCNCNKSQDRLISPVINAAMLNQLYLRFSAFQNGSGGQSAHVDVKAQGLPWYTLNVIPASSIWETYTLEIPGAYLKSNFQLRFFYNDGGNYASGLAIDDVMLTTSTEATFALTNASTIKVEPEGSGQAYDQIPLRQARNARWVFGGWVNNTTSETRNARILMDVQGPVPFNDTSESWLIPSGEEAHVSFGASTTYSPYEKGSYAVKYALLTDSIDPSQDDDEILSSFNVSDSIYRRTTLSANYQLGVLLQMGGDRFGAGYYFHSKDTVRAVYVNIHPASTVGTRFRVKIFSYDTLSSSSFITSSVEIVSDDLGSPIRVPINRVVRPGRHLFAIEKVPGEGNIVIAANSQRRAYQSNAMTRKSGQTWVASPYFPEIQLVLDPVDDACSGHIQYVEIDESCPGANDGFVSVELVNAPDPFTFSWSNGAGNVNTQSGLIPGTYSVSVTDSIGCIYSQSITIDSADTLEILPSLIPDSCNKKVGEINLNITGGTSPYHILWNGQIGAERKVQLESGTYQINVTDASNCFKNETIELDGTDALGIGLSITYPDCLDSNGVINTVPFGTPPFSFNWNTGDTTQTLDSLPAGVYLITIGDSLGCTTSEQIELSNNSSLAVSLNSTVQPNCFSEQVGEIDINVGGGQLPYSYSWSNADTTQDISGLGSGDYQVEVTDNTGCITYFSETIDETSEPLRVDLNDRGNYCWRDSLGVLEAIVSGGEPDYVFEWSTGSIDEKIEELPAGSFTLTVTDADGCTQIKTSQISDGLAFFSRIDSTIKDTSNNFIFESKIFVSTFGGTPPYHFIWNDSIESEDLINVPFGPYVLWVTDQLGCRETLSYILQRGPEGNASIYKEAEVTLFPNPLKTGQSLRLKSISTIQTVAIYTIDGTKLISMKAPFFSEFISVETLAPGSYMMEIITAKGVTYKKFIVI